jgi:hypothetical protein
VLSSGIDGGNARHFEASCLPRRIGVDSNLPDDCTRFVTLFQIAWHLMGVMLALPGVCSGITTSLRTIKVLETMLMRLRKFPR